MHDSLCKLMATFVLVHGAWLGGWCWRRVAPMLREAGHDVYTPTLTGLGDREHLVTPEVGLVTHIQDIANVLFYDDLTDVTLVGHSYGGFVVSGVADEAPERLRQLIYLAAVVPSGDGDSLFAQGPAEMREFVEGKAQAFDGWRWPLPSFAEIEQNSSMHGLDADDQRWFRESSVPQPVRTFSDPISLKGGAPESLRKTYIRCTGDYMPAPEITQGDGWRYRELDAGHWPMFSKPRDLAELLLKLV